jgi:hypothetical protein
MPNAPLRLLAVAGRGQRDDATDARRHCGSNAADDAPFSRGVAPLEYDNHLQPLGLDVLLKLDKLDAQLAQSVLVCSVWWRL